MRNGGSQLLGCTRSNDWYACLNKIHPYLGKSKTRILGQREYDKVKHGGHGTVAELAETYKW